MTNNNFIYEHHLDATDILTPEKEGFVYYEFPCLNPSQVVSLKPQRTRTKVPRSFVTTTETRTFTEYELEYLRQFGRVTQQRLLMITILELNQRKNGEIMLSMNILGDLLNSRSAADYMMKFLLKSVLEMSNQYSNMSEKVARKYRIKVSFKMCNLIFKMRKLAKSKSDTEKPTIETIEIMNAQEPEQPKVKTLPKTIPTLSRDVAFPITEDEETILLDMSETIILKRLYNLTFFTKEGLSPVAAKPCQRCKRNFCNLIYPVDKKDNKLFNVCSFCLDKDDTKKNILKRLPLAFTENINHNVRFCMDELQYGKVA